MTDLTFTTGGEFMVTQIAGNTERGVSFVDAYLGASMIVVDSGVILVHSEASSVVEKHALAEGLTVEREKV